MKFKNLDDIKSYLKERVDEKNSPRRVMYINNCDKDDLILPVTLFLVMLFNACMTYSSRHADILIDALDTG